MDRIAVADGIELAVHEWGSSDGPAVVLLHGGGLSSAEWIEIGPVLASRARRVIAFDARGCGSSDPDPQLDYGAATIAADLDTVRRRLDLDRFALVGHSFGAVAGCYYAASHPEVVSALVLVDGGPAEHTRPASLDSPPLVFADRGAAGAALARMLPRGFPDWYLDTRFATLADGSLVWRCDMAGRVAWSQAGGEPLVPGLWPYVEAVRAPTVVLHGVESPLFPHETALKMAELNPAIRVVEVDGAGHFVHIDRPDAVVAAVEELLG